MSALRGLVLLLVTSCAAATAPAETEVAEAKSPTVIPDEPRSMANARVVDTVDVDVVDDTADTPSCGPVPDPWTPTRQHGPVPDPWDPARASRTTPDGDGKKD